MIARILPMLALLTTTVAFAQLQPPSPGEPKPREAPQAQRAGEEQEATADQPPMVIPDAPPNAQQPNQYTEIEQPKTAKDGWDYANASSTVVIAVLTIALTWVACAQLKAQRASLEHTKAVERAYIKLFHHPPGVRVDTERLSTTPFQVRHHAVVSVRVENAGNTPAIVTRTLLQVMMTNAGIPDRPEYAEAHARPGYVSLVKDAGFTISAPFEFMSSSTPFDKAFRELRKQTQTVLYVVGYVDYIDKFGERHRAGYGRVYKPAVDDPSRVEFRTKPPVTAAGIEGFVQEHFPTSRFDRDSYEGRNNLVFIQTPGYNYDRKRKKGEGNDWDEPEQ